jgi:hypothetical protein
VEANHVHLILEDKPSSAKVDVITHERDFENLEAEREVKQIENPVEDDTRNLGYFAEMLAKICIENFYKNKK